MPPSPTRRTRQHLPVFDISRSPSGTQNIKPNSIKYCSRFSENSCSRWKSFGTMSPLLQQMKHTIGLLFLFVSQSLQSPTWNLMWIPKEHPLNNYFVVRNACIIEVDTKGSNGNTMLILRTNHPVENHTRLPWSGNILWITIHKQKQKGLVYDSKPTLLLNGPHMNPGHQYGDILTSLYQLLHHTQLPFQQWTFALQSPQCSLWICYYLPYFWDVIGHASVVEKKDLNTCFQTLWIPRFGYHRGEVRGPVLNSRFITNGLRAKVTQHFTSPTNVVLFYGKELPATRRWLNAQQESIRYQERTGKHTRYIPNMTSLTIKEQCRLFWNAAEIFYVHGGQTANLICARPGTKVTEMSCARRIGWFQTMWGFQQHQGIRYNYIHVPNCTGTGFYQPFEYVLQ